MVGYNMNGPTRDQVLQFMEEKERIEREIQELTAVLETNNVGMHDALVDSEGYPRGDVDVYRVRHARHRILCLQNDHKEVMKQIERGLQMLHAQFRDGPAGENSIRNNVQPMEISTQTSNGYTSHGLSNGLSHGLSNGLSNGLSHRADESVAAVERETRRLRVADRPFARVNLVSPGSPADVAGIRVDDEILQFGSVDCRNFTALTQLASVAQHSVGARVTVRVRRGDAVLCVALTPAPWAGRGLIGCNVVPV